VFAAVGFSLAGLSQPLLWATITMLASFLPVVGTAAVWVPVSVVTFAMGRTGAAIFIAIWGFLVVTAVADYVVRPRLVGSHTQVHPLPLLISLIGGVEMLGLMGVLVGPVVMALCLAVLRIYEAERMRDGDPATVTPTPVSD
jgi:predicted PurR-regulated permease PerM